MTDKTAPLEQGVKEISDSLCSAGVLIDSANTVLNIQIEALARDLSRSDPHFSIEGKETSPYANDIVAYNGKKVFAEVLKQAETDPALKAALNNLQDNTACVGKDPIGDQIREYDATLPRNEKTGQSPSH